VKHRTSDKFIRDHFRTGSAKFGHFTSCGKNIDFVMANLYSIIVKHKEICYNDIYNIYKQTRALYTYMTYGKVPNHKYGTNLFGPFKCRTNLLWDQQSLDVLPFLTNPTCKTHSTGFTVFAVQNGGWCASSATAGETYTKYGESTDCVGDGEGGGWANRVYRIGFRTYIYRTALNFVF
jgi:hypothetical protein